MTAREETAAPEIAYGFWRYGPGDLDAALEMLAAARALGITHFDTADVYGGPDGFGAAEALLGEARQRAPELFDGAEIATKIGIEFGAPYNSSKDYLARAADASLERLQMDCVDLLYIHRPDLMAHPGDVAEALDRLVVDGKVRALAVSNHTPQQIEALAAYLEAPLCAHQVEFSVLHAEPIFDGVFDQAMASDLPVYAWSPLAGGRLFGDDARAMRLRAALAPIADKHGCSITAAALAFVMRHPAQPTPIVGTRNKTRLEDAAVARSIRLDRSEWYNILEQSLDRKMP